MSEVTVISVNLKDILGEVEKKGSRLFQTFKPVKNFEDDDGVLDALTDCIAVKMVQEVVWCAVPEEITAVADKFVCEMLSAVDIKELIEGDQEKA